MSLVVFGSANLDLFITVPSLPLAPGSTSFTSTKNPFLRKACGGKGANQAIASANLLGKDKVTFVGNMGSSSGFGSVLRENFAKFGVIVIEVEGEFERVCECGTAVIMVSEANGDNVIVVAPGSNFEIPAITTINNPVISALLTSPNSHLLLTQFETPPRSVLEILTHFKKTTILNPAPSPDKWAISEQPLFAEILLNVTILIPNEEELVGCYSSLFPGVLPIPDFQLLAGEILTAFPNLQAIVVTLGAKGAMVVTQGGGSVNVHEDGSPWKDDPVVDTVGAGDAFCGAFATKLLRNNEDLVDAARFGCKCAGYSVRKEGAQTSYITITQEEEEEVE
ncbi:hypothetical protein ScalyP_jg3650 [Parmales sp. scaly parma]|nr:hypothetical protein ScalyP_jg3650 [Parmales sp. scaly parma]